MSHTTVRSLAVGVVAAAWAAGFMAAHGYRDRIPSGEEANIAIHLARGHGYKSPMDPSPTAPPTAWSPPVYTAIIGTAYRLFGVESPRAIVLLVLLNALFFGAVAAGIYRLGTLVFRSEAPALFGAALVAIHPLFVLYMGNLWDGVISLAMFLWLAAASAQRGMAAEAGAGATRLSAIALGAGMGVLALTNTSYVATYPVLVLVAFPKCLSSKRWPLAALALAGCLVVVIPWTVRNYEAFGRLVVVRTGAGILLWMGNSPQSSGWLDEQAYALDPYNNPDERQLILKIGEPAYDALAVARFGRDFAQRPSAYFVRCVHRAVGLLLGQPTQPPEWGRLLINGAIAALGFAGMLGAWRRGYAQRGLPVLAACVTLPFIPTAVIERYRLPLLSLLLLYAAAFVWMLAARPNPPPADQIAAGSG